MTLEASSEIVLATTAPQPSSNAFPMTFAFVPGGPEPMTKGLGSFKPLTVVSSVGITTSSQIHLTTEATENTEKITEKKEQNVILLLCVFLCVLCALCGSFLS